VRLGVVGHSRPVVIDVVARTALLGRAVLANNVAFEVQPEVVVG